MEQEAQSSPQANENAFSDALSSILSNHDMMEKIRTIAGQMRPDNAEQSSMESPIPQQSTTIPSDGLASVLSDPDLMAKLPQMMTLLKPMLAANSNATDKGNKKTSEDCRNDLLLALKPFLSAERCQAIDTMLRISKLGTVIRQIK